MEEQNFNYLHLLHLNIFEVNPQLWATLRKAGVENVLTL